MILDMNRLEEIDKIRAKLKNGGVSIGTWIQIPHPSSAEILGDGDYDWIAVDLEHGSITHNLLPDLFRAIELGGTLPLARIAEASSKECKEALDAGAGGVIVPMVESKSQLERVMQYCQWPPKGRRGVAFSRANLFGRYFERYKQEAQTPIVVAMIESVNAVNNLKDILDVEGLDAVLIGPYDLTASMGITGEFENSEFKKVMVEIKNQCRNKVACGVHIVEPSVHKLQEAIDNGYQFLPYSIDSVFLNTYAHLPEVTR